MPIKYSVKIKRRQNLSLEIRPEVLPQPSQSDMGLFGPYSNTEILSVEKINVVRDGVGEIKK